MANVLGAYVEKRFCSDHRGLGGTIRAACRDCMDPRILTLVLDVTQIMLRIMQGIAGQGIPVVSSRTLMCEASANLNIRTCTLLLKWQWNFCDLCLVSACHHADSLFIVHYRPSDRTDLQLGGPLQQLSTDG